MCPPFTRTTDTPLINGLVDDLLVKSLPAGAHSVLEIVQVGNWNAICDTRSAAELPREHSRPDLSRSCWVGFIQTVRWNSAWYATGTWQLTSFDETARRPVETRNDRRISGEFPGEDIAAAEFRRSNLHLPWFLCRIVDKVNWCLAGFGYCDGRHHAYAEVLAALDQKMTCNGRFRKRLLTELTAHFFCRPIHLLD